MNKYSLKVPTEASKIESYTGVNPDELNEEISSTYRALLEAKRIVSLKKQLKDIRLAVLMEKRKNELAKHGQDPSQTALRTFALAQPEYLAAIHEEDEAKGQEIILEAKHKQLRDRLKTLYEEARLAREELYTLRQKQ